MLKKERWYSLLVLGACVLFSFILYAPALDSYFVSEDLRHLNFDWSEVMAEWSSYGQSVGFRPGTVLYLVINNLLWARNQVGHHAGELDVGNGNMTVLIARDAFQILLR